jgi:hypothetical protein
MVTSCAGSQVKRKMVKIGTHNGSFHCDEALGCFLLKQTDLFKDADIIRTRDEDILKQLKSFNIGSSSAFSMLSAIIEASET